MALKYLSNIDLNGNQLRGASIEPLSSAPSDHLVAGRTYYNTSNDRLFIHTGSAFIQVGTTYSTSSLGDIWNRTKLVSFPKPSSPKSVTVTPLKTASVPGSNALGSTTPAILICTPGPGIALTPDIVRVLPTGISSANPSPVIVIVLVLLR